MSDDVDQGAELAAAADPLFVQPTEADKAPRTVKAAAWKPVPADPDAPYGYTRDAVTGEMRPKKAPGRGPGKGAQRAATPPPAKRVANKPRVVSAEAATIAKRSHAQMAADLVDSLWMLTAAVPVAPQGAKMGAVNVHELSLKAKAQGAILREQKPALVQGAAELAAHSEPVRRGLEFLAAENGPGWVLPVCMAFMPFILQSQALWRGAAELAAPLAERTQREWQGLVEAMAGGGNVDGDQAAAPALRLVRTDG